MATRCELARRVDVGERPIEPVDHGARTAGVPVAAVVERVERVSTLSELLRHPRVPPAVLRGPVREDDDRAGAVRRSPALPVDLDSAGTLEAPVVVSHAHAVSATR